MATVKVSKKTTAKTETTAAPKKAVAKVAAPKTEKAPKEETPKVVGSRGRKPMIMEDGGRQKFQALLHGDLAQAVKQMALDANASIRVPLFHAVKHYVEDVRAGKIKAFTDTAEYDAYLAEVPAEGDGDGEGKAPAKSAKTAPTGKRPKGSEEVTTTVAAKALGITESAVEAGVKKGTIPGEPINDGKSVTVYLPKGWEQMDKKTLTARCKQLAG